MKDPFISQKVTYMGCYFFFYLMPNDIFIFLFHLCVLQKPYHAQIALNKNGTQLNSLLIVGVKPVDPMHRHHLKESAHQINQGGFMVSLPSKVGTLSRSSNHADKTSNYSADKRHHHTIGIIATPANSLVSKVIDLVFGM